ncbi:MAG: glycosyltransferase family 2 protein [Candidatus Omnitrophica bacterium]|nr:glycosyltransferase family 2 protein [Candidatus Omnitrophota bacterium]
MENLFSVVVPTRNRGDISECLLMILQQSYRPLELVVVDQSTDSGTKECVERVIRDHAEDGNKIVYVPTDQAGLSNARNLGVSKSEGEWIAFVDDDVLVTHEWAERLVEEYKKDPKLGMVFGQTRAYYKPDGAKRIRVSIKDLPTPQRFRSRFGLIANSAGGGGNSSISRDCFDRVGPFHPKLGVGGVYPGAEDYDLTYRVLRAGYEIQYASNAITHHKRWLPEEDYLRTERGYYTGRAAAIAKQIRSADPIAPLGALLELGRRLIEIPYHLVVTRHMRNTRRAVVRTQGFVKGLMSGLLEKW